MDSANTFSTSPVNHRNLNTQLKAQVELVQRRATTEVDLVDTYWSDAMQDRLHVLALDLLTLSYDRELKDLVFFNKCLYGHTDQILTFKMILHLYLMAIQNLFNLYAKVVPFRPHTLIL